MDLNSADGMYSPQKASWYGSIGVQGTTYEIGFSTLADIISSLQPPPHRSLDFGSGPGRTLRLLSELGVEAIGLDNSRSMLAEMTHPTRLKLLGDHRIPIKTGCLDLVLCVSVLIEIRDKEQLVNLGVEFGRVLAPGGRAIIMTTNPQAFTKRFRNFEFSAANEPRSGVTYESIIKPESKPPFTLQDTFWSTEDYREALTAGRLAITGEFEPTAPKGPEWEGSTEAETPPFLILICQRRATD